MGKGRRKKHRQQQDASLDRRLDYRFTDGERGALAAQTARAVRAMLATLPARIDAVRDLAVDGADPIDLWQGVRGPLRRALVAIDDIVDAPLLAGRLARLHSYGLLLPGEFQSFSDRARAAAAASLSPPPPELYWVEDSMEIDHHARGVLTECEPHRRPVDVEEPPF